MIKTWLWLSLRWFPVVAVALLAATFTWRRLWRRLPFFFFYLVFALLVVALGTVSSHISREAYFYSYWITEFAGAVVVLLPMYEIFLRRLFPSFQKNRFYRNIFPAFAAL